MLDYYLISIKLFSRSIKNLGIHPTLGWFCILVIFLLWPVALLYRFENYGQYLVVVSSFYIVSIIQSNNRLNFWKIFLSRKDLLVNKSVEAMLLILIPLFVLLLYGFYISAFFLLCLTLAIGMLNITYKTSSKGVNPYRKQPFEWTVGFRLYFPYWVITYFIFILGFVVGNIKISVFAIALVYLISLNHYSYIEPKYFVSIFKMESKLFLNKKLKTLYEYSMLTVLPMGIILGLVDNSMIWFVLGVIIVGLGLNIVMFLAKYAYYPMPVGLIHAIILLFSIVIPPLMIPLALFLYGKGKSNLNLIVDLDN